jgi:hypothetical protein
VARQFCSWQQRWDDPRREYRTLYCAEQPETCLAEVLADLRPNTMMLTELAELMGESPELLEAAGTVDPGWRALHSLQAARLLLDGELADVEDLRMRAELERRHAILLAAHGMDHLNISEIRSRARVVTQTIGRHLYDDGYAGLAFSSNIDGRPCFALFEGRFELQPVDEPLRMTDDLAILSLVCAQLGLRLRTA